MTIDAQILPPAILGFWIKMIRTASSLSQDALAEASGLTVRTIQRVEAGGRASLTTRRCLARGLRYDNPDIFDDSGFAATVIRFMESLRNEQIKVEEERHPDHIKLEVSPVLVGSDFGRQIESCDAWVFNCDDEIEAEDQAEAANLFDNLQDYGDIWSELPHSGRVKAQGSFSEMLAGLTGRGLRTYQAVRRVQLVPTAANQAPLPFTIGYVTVFPGDRQVSHILVPKRG